jgi:hypothetical protein
VVALAVFEGFNESGDPRVCQLEPTRIEGLFGAIEQRLREMGGPANVVRRFHATQAELRAEIERLKELLTTESDNRIYMRERAASAEFENAELRAEIANLTALGEATSAELAGSQREVRALRAKIEGLKAKFAKPKCRCTGWNITPPEVCDSFTPWDEDEGCRECCHELKCHSPVEQEIAALRAKVAAGEECGCWKCDCGNTSWIRDEDPCMCCERIAAARAAGLGGEE